MNAQQYIEKLTNLLSGLSESDLRASVEYYLEALEDRLEDGMTEEEAIRELGTPEAAAEKILQEVSVSKRALAADPKQDSAVNVTTPFTGICVQSEDCDVRFVQSSDGKCVVSHANNRFSTCSVRVEEGVLTIEAASKSRFSLSGFLNMGRGTDVVISLPSKPYQSLSVWCGCGDVDVPSFAFETARVESDSGDIRFQAAANEIELVSKSGDIEYSGSRDLPARRGSLSTVSGDIHISSIKGGNWEIDAANGDTEIRNASAFLLNANSSNGDIRLSHVILENTLAVSTANGDISLIGCDAQNVTLETANGDIRASLLTPKQFHAESSCGDVRVPVSAEGGICTAASSSGDITITLQK